MDDLYNTSTQVLLCCVPCRLGLEVIDPFDLTRPVTTFVCRLLDKVVGALEHLDDLVFISLVDEVVLAELFRTVLDRRAQQDNTSQGTRVL